MVEDKDLGRTRLRLQFEPKLLLEGFLKRRPDGLPIPFENVAMGTLRAPRRNRPGGLSDGHKESVPQRSGKAPATVGIAPVPAGICHCGVGG